MLQKIVVLAIVISYVFWSTRDVDLGLSVKLSIFFNLSEVSDQCELP